MVIHKEHVKLIQRVKLYHSFLHVIPKLFHFTILNLSRWFHTLTYKNSSEPFTNNKGIGHTCINQSWAKKQCTWSAFIYSRCVRQHVPIQTRAVRAFSHILVQLCCRSDYCFNWVLCFRYCSNSSLKTTQGWRGTDNNEVSVICLAANEWNSYTSMLERRSGDDSKVKLKWNWKKLPLRCHERHETVGKWWRR